MMVEFQCLICGTTSDFHNQQHDRRFHALHEKVESLEGKVESLEELCIDLTRIMTKGKAAGSAPAEPIVPRMRLECGCGQVHHLRVENGLFYATGEASVGPTDVAPSPELPTEQEGSLASVDAVAEKCRAPLGLSGPLRVYCGLDKDHDGDHQQFKLLPMEDIHHEAFAAGDVEQDILDYVQERSEARSRLVDGFTSIVSAREAVRCADVVIEQGWAPRLAASAPADIVWVCIGQGHFHTEPPKRIKVAGPVGRDTYRHACGNVIYSERPPEGFALKAWVSQGREA